MAEFDVFVGNHTIVDMDIYDLWLRGLNAEEAAEVLFSTQDGDSIKGRGGGGGGGGGGGVGGGGGGSAGRRSTTNSRDSSSAPGGVGGVGGVGEKDSLGSHRSTSAFQFLLADVHDHYRTLVILERFLQNPPNLVEQLNFQLTARTRANLIRKYYEYDEVVFREFAGKKLSTRSRNALDDAADRFGVKTKSCRRQFDNVKRVHKLVEDMDGSLVDNIRAQFLLPASLAGQYACMVFIINHRFELTGKRKLNYVTFGDITHCAQGMMEGWTPRGRDDGDADLDRDFLMDLRELKALAERDALEEHKSAVVGALKGKKIVEERSLIDLEANFKNYSRALIHIASGLNHGKEARDIFVDVVEKIVEPARNARWIYADLSRFLAQYETSAKEMPVVANNNKLQSVLDRFLTTMTSCILRLYHS